MKLRGLVALLLCSTVALACRQTPPQVVRPQVGRFGCPPSWGAVEDTFAALRGKERSSVYMGTDPPQGEGTITCVAKGEYALPAPYSTSVAEQKPIRRPLAPVWLKLDPESITI